MHDGWVICWLVTLNSTVGKDDLWWFFEYFRKKLSYFCIFCNITTINGFYLCKFDTWTLTFTFLYAHTLMMMMITATKLRVFLVWQSNCKKILIKFYNCKVKVLGHVIMKHMTCTKKIISLNTCWFSFFTCDIFICSLESTWQSIIALKLYNYFFTTFKNKILLRKSFFLTINDHSCCCSLLSCSSIVFFYSTESNISSLISLKINNSLSTTTYIFSQKNSSTSRLKLHSIQVKY